MLMMKFNKFKLSSKTEIYFDQLKEIQINSNNEKIFSDISDHQTYKLNWKRSKQTTFHSVEN